MKPALYVTNFNKNFTGVSATAANVLRQQIKHYDLRLVGHPLPGCPDPISLREARRLAATPPVGKAFSIWHVRRNPEMRAAIWARDVLRLPIKIVFTSAAQRRHSLVPRWLISKMDAVVATTEAAAGFVPHVRATVPHGVDTDLFHPAEARDAAWAQTGYGGTMGIATIGRVRPEKGTDLFVDAMIEALPNLPGATALVIGRAARKHQKFDLDLKDRVQRARLVDRIRFVGEVQASALPPLMRALSLVVQLPRYEGYGMAPLEGMASGVPFIGSTAGYYEAFSAQGTTGVIVPQENASEAAQATQAILGDPARYATLAQNARRIAVESFSAQSEAAGIDRVYQELWAEKER